MKLIAALAVSAMLLMGLSDNSAPRRVSAIRYTPLGDVTRVAVEISGSFEFHTDRLHNPERVYFDILNSRPWIGDKRFYKETVADKLLLGIRIAETTPGTTRVVLDLAPNVEVSTSRLTNPEQLIIALRTKDRATGHTEASPADRTIMKPAAAPPQAPVNTAAARSDGRAPATSTETPAPVSLSPLPLRPAAISLKTPVRADVERSDGRVPGMSLEAPSGAPTLAQVNLSPLPIKPPSIPPKATGKTDVTGISPEAASVAPAPAQANLSPLPIKPSSTPPKATVKTEVSGISPEAPKLEGSGTDNAALHAPTASEPEEIAKAARLNSSGNSSLIRALGLKINRVVIDAGHGGHDQGTEGPKGLLEKDLVLDVSQRVGKLVDDRMGAEVIYTRSEDNFVTLEGRTALANEKKADLFLSIHANSSGYPRISGVETYYLNINGSKDAMELAARENGPNQSSIFELQDIIRKIALNDKSEESKEFAKRVQAALYAFTLKRFPGTIDRGVKSAPFKVLIGADMPSILVEIGFVTNSREEALLKTSDYRQKLAEALYSGMEKYALGLSHFQAAAKQ